MTQVDLKSNWNQLKGSLKKRFGVLTDDDLIFAEGKGDEMLGRLQSKLGLGKEELDAILAELNDSSDAAGHKMDRAKAKAGEVYEDVKARAGTLADDAKAALSEKADDLKGHAKVAYADARAQFRTGQEHVEEYVRGNPSQALVTALGVGFVLGLLIRK